jgi:hypothetical protein
LWWLSLLIRIRRVRHHVLRSIRLVIPESQPKHLIVAHNSARFPPLRKIRNVILAHRVVQEGHIQRQSRLFLVLDFREADRSAARAGVCAVDVFLSEPGDETFAMECVVAMCPNDLFS